MSKRTVIDDFIGSKKIAIAGVSRNPNKFGHIVFSTLKNKGYEVYPVNPHTDTIGGCTCYHTVADLPGDIKNLLITTAQKDSETVLKAAIDRGFKNIWLQSGCESPNCLRMANENNVNLVSGCCILMYAQPKGFHKFHQTLAKLFGKYEK